MMIQLGLNAVTLRYWNRLGYCAARKDIKRVARGVAGDDGTFTYLYRPRLRESDVNSDVWGGEDNESS